MTACQLSCLLLLAVCASVYGGTIIHKLVDCSSQNNQRATCPVAGAGSWTKISLIEQNSTAACTLDTSFGFAAGKVWVDNGCRGKFQVFSCTSHILQKCESQSSAYKACTVSGATQVKHMEVANQLSTAACTEASFGITGNSVWTHHGCRARFNICY